MVFDCPVCDTPHPDAVHLSNHLAFTALLGRDDHESWLDERVPDWGDSNPTELADALTEHVEPTEDNRFADLDTEPARVARGPTSLPEDPDVRRIVEDARRMTEQMYGDNDSDNDNK